MEHATLERHEFDFHVARSIRRQWRERLGIDRTHAANVRRIGKPQRSVSTRGTNERNKFLKRWPRVGQTLQHLQARLRLAAFVTNGNPVAQRLAGTAEFRGQTRRGKAQTKKRRDADGRPGET